MRRMLFAGLLVVCAMTGLPSNAEKALAADSLTTPIPVSSPFACDVDCAENACDPGEHDAWDTVPAFYFWTRNGGAHSGGACFEGTCATRHGPYCPADGDLPTNSEMELLRSSIMARDAQTVADILAAHPQTMTLNIDRSAIQSLNCKGLVTFHLPLTDSLLTAIAASSMPRPD